MKQLSFGLENELMYPKSEWEEIIPKQFKAPFTVLWELTSNCSLRCIHCYNKSGVKTDFELTPDQIQSVVEQLVALDVISVCLSGGDPILNEEFFNIAKQLRERDIFVNTITNGWLITEDIADKLERYFNTVQISLDGGKKETHDYIRGRKGSFQRAIQSLKLLNERFLNLRVVYVLSDDNYEEFIPLMSELTKYSGIRKIIASVPFPVGRATESEFSIKSENLAKIKGELQNIVDSFPFEIILEESIGGTVYKTGLLERRPNSHMQIDPSGNIRLYSWLGLKFGNVKEQLLQNIWDESLGKVWNHPQCIQYISEFVDCNGAHPSRQRSLPYTADEWEYSDLERIILNG